MCVNPYEDENELQDLHWYDIFLFTWRMVHFCVQFFQFAQCYLLSCIYSLRHPGTKLHYLVFSLVAQILKKKNRNGT